MGRGPLDSMLQVGADGRPKLNIIHHPRLMSTRIVFQKRLRRRIVGGAKCPAVAETQLEQFLSAMSCSGLDGGNAFKIPLAARAMVATLRQLAPEA